MLIRSPQVLAQIRTFFACPTLSAAGVEDDGGEGSVGAYWEERIHEVRTLEAYISYILYVLYIYIL